MFHISMQSVIKRTKANLQHMLSEMECADEAA